MTHVKVCSHRKLLSSPLVITAIAILLREGFILILRLSSKQVFFGEMASVGRALTAGQGFSSPCPIPTGPTALVPPVYPLLVAAAFKFLGVYSDRSAAILLLLNSLFSGLVCLVLVAVGRRTVGTKAAILGAWAWALWPMALWESHRIWESSLSVLLFTVVFLSVLIMQEKSGAVFGALCGLLWGVAALTNPAVLAFVIPAAFFETLRRKVAWSTLPAAPTVALLIMCVTVSPWIIRNYLVFHRIIPIRDGLPLELYLGNRALASGENVLAAQPCVSRNENRKMAQIGETQYLQLKEQQAKTFIMAHPLEFCTRATRRAFYFWVSTPESWLDVGGSKRALFEKVMKIRRPLYALSSILALIGLLIAWHHRRSWLIFFAILLIVPPLPYYLTHGENRYRHPIEPEIMLLAAYTIVAVTRARHQTSQSVPTIFRQPSGAAEDREGSMMPENSVRGCGSNHLRDA